MWQLIPLFMQQGQQDTLNLISFFRNWWMQDETMRREDNAVERRARDLENAGFNRILSTGQGAQSNMPMRLQPPQAGQNFMQGLGMAQGIEKMKAETDLINANKENQLIQNKYAEDWYSGRVRNQELINQFNQQSMSSRLKFLAHKATIEEKRILYEESKARIKHYEAETWRFDYAERKAILIAKGLFARWIAENFQKYQDKRMSEMDSRILLNNALADYHDRMPQGKRPFIPRSGWQIFKDLVEEVGEDIKKYYGIK